MSDSEWSPELGSSWSSNHEPTKSRVSIGDMEIVQSGEIIMDVTLPQGSMDPEEGSAMNPKEQFLEDSEEEFLGDPKGDFLPGLIQSKIWELHLEML